MNILLCLVLFESIINSLENLIYVGIWSSVSDIIQNLMVFIIGDVNFGRPVR